MAVFKDVVMNKYIWTWWLFKVFCNSSAQVGSSVGSVYLTNDLGFDKEDLAFVSLITTPVGILISIAAGYLVNKRPIKNYYICFFISFVFDAYYILYMLRTFPEKENRTNWTIAHVAAVSIISSFESSFSFVSSYAFIMRVTDKRISGIYVTMLAALSNFSYHIHKFYIFELIERFGIFVP